jgi:hypothetical protein
MLRVFAGLAIGLAASGCVDSANPVIPSTIPGGGLSTGGSSDGGGAYDGLVSRDVELAASDATAGNADYAAALDASDASSGTCDILSNLLTQSGCLPSQACYPVLSIGAGLCQLRGGQGPLGSCFVDETQPSCMPGLICIPLASLGTLGACLSLCDLSTPTVYCGIGNVCLLLPGFLRSSNVGYCQSA